MNKPLAEVELARIERADQLFELAAETHMEGMRQAAKIEDPEKRRAAFEACSKLWDKQREYQRQVRTGESR